MYEGPPCWDEFPTFTIYILMAPLIAILVHDTPLTPLNPLSVMPLTILYLNATTTQNFELLAQKVSELSLVHESSKNKLRTKLRRMPFFAI